MKTGYKKTGYGIGNSFTIFQLFCRDPVLAW
jgi:hypothetical protein